MPTRTFTTGSGTWTVPSGINQVTVECVGAGGGGGSAGNTRAGLTGTNYREGGAGGVGGGNGGNATDGAFGAGGGGGASDFGGVQAPGGGGGATQITGSNGGRGGGNNAGAGGVLFSNFASGGSGGRVSNAQWRGSTGASNGGRGGRTGSRNIVGLEGFGSGGAGNTTGAGGGGGAYQQGILNIVAAQTIAYQVGVGGGGGGALLSAGSQGQSGVIRITWPDPNHPPSVNITTAAQRVVEGETLQLGANAADRDGTIVGYLWAATVGTLSSTNIASPTWTAPLQTSEAQEVTISVVVTDDDRATASDSITLTVQPWGRIFLGSTKKTLYLGATQKKIYFDGKPYG